MNRFTRITTAIALGGAVLAFAGASQAQQGGPQQGGGYGQQPDLHALLHIHPEQETAWQAYKSATPSQAEIQAMQINPAQLGAMSAPHRLDRIEAMLNAQLSMFHRQASATRALYAVLTPDQKRTFDQVTAPPSRGGPPQR